MALADDCWTCECVPLLSYATAPARNLILSPYIHLRPSLSSFRLPLRLWNKLLKYFAGAENLLCQEHLHCTVLPACLAVKSILVEQRGDEWKQKKLETWRKQCNYILFTTCCLVWLSLRVSVCGVLSLTGCGKACVCVCVCGFLCCWRCTNIVAMWSWRWWRYVW